MTQKEREEYEKEKEEYEYEIRELKSSYMQTLENYQRINEELRTEREYNRQNCTTIKALQETIERYEKMLDRVTYNC